MKSEILGRAWIRQQPHKYGRSFKLSVTGFVFYQQARRQIKKRNRFYDLRLEIGERKNVHGPYRHIHQLVMKPLRYGRRKSKLVHCDWAKIYAKQSKPVKRQELDGLQWIELNRFMD